MYQTRNARYWRIIGGGEALFEQGAVVDPFMAFSGAALMDLVGQYRVVCSH